MVPYIRQSPAHPETRTRIGGAEYTGEEVDAMVSQLMLVRAKQNQSLSPEHAAKVRGDNKVIELAIRFLVECTAVAGIDTVSERTGDDRYADHHAFLDSHAPDEFAVILGGKLVLFRATEVK